MDRQDSWKRTEDSEIDLADLLRRLLGQWKRIALCALACALLFGGYGWVKGKADWKAAQSAAAGEPLSEEDGDALTETEKQAVADAVQLEHELGGLEMYLDNSVLMQIDAYHKNRTVMLYGIHHAKRQELAAITESYLSFLLHGGAADALKKSGSRWNMDKSCLAELIYAYQKTYSSPYQLAVENLADERQTAESLFYVEITGKNAAQTAQLAQDVQDVLEEYFSAVSKTAGNHQIALISEMESVTADTSLQAQQHEKKALLSSNRTSLRAMTDAFNEKQMAAYMEAAGVKDSRKGQENEEILQAPALNAKYILLGLLGGIFVYCAVFSCGYLFRDTVKSSEEMKRMYTFPVFGSISVENTKKKKPGWTAGKRINAYGSAETQAANRIRLMCKKQEITKLYAILDYLPGEKDAKSLNTMIQQLHSFGISMQTVENASADMDVWDGLAETGKVLLVCRTGVTTHRMIQEAMEFYLENGMEVSGAVVFAD